jgi:hypothetical protein
MAVEIPLTKGFTAIVDEEDADLAKLKWCARVVRGGYAYGYRYVSTKPYKGAHLHRAVMERSLGRELVDGEFVDHIDHNTMNNTRSNLRIASRSENARNRRLGVNSISGLKGAYYFAPTGKWTSGVYVNGRVLHLGYFNTPEEAHAAYIAAALEHYGPYANDGTQSLAHIAQAQQESRS